MADLETPVLIVGGSLVGMSTALLLGHHGIRSMAVEHHRGTAIHPRAAQVTQRTMEIFRTVGIEQIVRRKSDEQFVQDGAVMAVETLAGKELAYFIANLNEGIRDVSPCERVFISQSLLEPLLKSRAEELGAELRFATDLVSFEQDADGVTATIRHRDTGREDVVRAQYMVAADGAHSGVRERLGVPMRGHGVFSKSATIYFRADIAPLLRGRNLSVIYVNNDRLRGFFRIEKPFDSGFLAINALGDPAHPITDVTTGLTNERCIELIRTALGADDVPVTVDNVMNWDATADVSERMQVGRIFIAGDAAHVMPPNGGFGGNTGVQDADNLSWKLAMVLRRQVGPELLSTYEVERFPVGELTTEQAYSRYVTRTAPFLGTEGMQPVIGDLNIELGYVYRSRAVCLEGDDVPLHEHPRDSKGRPGTRAPHVWIDEAHSVSTLDLFGTNFALLAGRDGQAWCDAARTVSAESGITIDTHRLGTGQLARSADAIADAYGIGDRGAMLVRPDAFVAWRTRSQSAPVSDQAIALARVLDSITCHAG